MDLLEIFNAAHDKIKVSHSGMFATTMRKERLLGVLFLLCETPSIGVERCRSPQQPSGL